MDCYKLASPGKHIQSSENPLQHIQCGVHYVFMNMNTRCLCGFIKTFVPGQISQRTSTTLNHFWGWRNRSVVKDTCCFRG